MESGKGQIMPLLLCTNGLQFYDPAKQSYSLRFKDWRYIRYVNGKEELYHTAKDDHEWNNLAVNPEYSDRLSDFFEKNFSIIPKSRTSKPITNEQWKDFYFKKSSSGH